MLVGNYLAKNFTFFALICQMLKYKICFYYVRYRMSDIKSLGSLIECVYRVSKQTFPNCKFVPLELVS